MGQRSADAEAVKPVGTLAPGGGNFHDGAQLFGTLEESVAQFEADVEIQRRRGQRIVQLDLALYKELAIRRLGLHALQASHAFVDGHAAHEIAQTDLGKSQSLSQKRVARDDQLGLAVAQRTRAAGPGQ